MYRTPKSDELWKFRQFLATVAMATAVLGFWLLTCAPAVAANGPDGRPPNRGGYDTIPAQAAKNAWQLLKTNWNQCLQSWSRSKRFDAETFGRLLTKDIIWEDGRREDIRNRTIDSFSHNGDQTRVIGYLYGKEAITIQGTNYVIIGPNYFTADTPAQQMGIMVHEALHVLTKFDDERLAGFLMNYGFVPSKSFRSHEMTDWIVGTKDHTSLNGGCPKTWDPSWSPF